MKSHNLVDARPSTAPEMPALSAEEIVSALRPRLVRMALYYAHRSREDPDDLLQEAWAGMLEALREVNPHIGDPEQYLLKHARWQLLDVIRRARVRRHAGLENEESEHLANSSTAGDQTAVEVAEFIARLKPNQRAVLMCLLAGLTWREAGHTLGCSSANVAYHVRQIRRTYEHWSAGE
jgi:RNA polymerase sigma factor (sigma-70 family)